MSGLPLPTMSIGEIHVWAACPSTLPLDSVHRAFLIEEEKARFSRFHFERDRWTFLAGRVVTRTLAHHYAGASPDTAFRYSTYGKPHFPNAALQFNISHSGGCLVVAFTRGKLIGIDIEEIRPGLEFERLAKRFFSEREQVALKQSQDAASQFYQIWTRKEAFIKADGRGVNLPLERFSVVEGTDGAQVCTMDLAEKFPPLVLHDFLFGPLIKGAICHSPAQTVKFFRYEQMLLDHLIEQ
ncbi:MAG: 4'-phosphopantetheinyl transferase superfamily protein [Saprospiraceae bacterium]|nr:4'-phosphopantetheinyl transferase superfamily protein [Saprospiraceae bacterium]